MRLAIVALAALAVVACGTSHPFGTRTVNTTTKRIIFEENSINLHPMAVKVTEVEGQVETTGTEMVFPDGSYVTLTGGGAAGNLTVVPMQNDGVQQDADTKTDAQADVTADVPVVDEGKPMYIVDENGDRR